jgi:hypothetical protein
MQDSEVYIKTDAGRDEIKARTLGLPMSVRAILLMVDGQRSVSEMRSLIAGSKAPSDVLETLYAQGLIEPLNGVAPAAATPPSAVTAIEAATRIADPVPRPVAAPPGSVRAGPPAKAPAKAAYDGPLDLELPSIDEPSIPPADSPVAPPVFKPLAQSEGGPVLSRYEHLYTMMNEVVRDFLAPHRRYFLQLKIERCGTPEELMELLHDLQTALAKSRGEAFASDVIARLRNAAD